MSDFAAVLARLSRVAGVRGALIVDAQAGVSVLAELAADVDGTAVAALSASLFMRACRATEGPGFGALQTFQLEADSGHLVAAGTRDLAVVVLTDPSAQLGLIRLETRRAAEGLV